MLDTMGKVEIDGCLIDMPDRWREVGRKAQGGIIETVKTLAAWDYVEKRDGDFTAYLTSLLRAQTIAYGVMRKGWGLRPIRKTPKAQRPQCTATKPNQEQCQAKAKRGYEICNRHLEQAKRTARMEFRAMQDSNGLSPNDTRPRPPAHVMTTDLIQGNTAP